MTSGAGAELLRNGKFLRLRTEQDNGGDSSEGSEGEKDRRVKFQEEDSNNGREIQQEGRRRSLRHRH